MLLFTGGEAAGRGAVGLEPERAPGGEAGDREPRGEHQDWKRQDNVLGALNGHATLEENWHDEKPSRVERVGNRDDGAEDSAQSLVQHLLGVLRK